MVCSKNTAAQKLEEMLLKENLCLPYLQEI
jgi:hypothetical protein